MDGSNCILTTNGWLKLYLDKHEHLSFDVKCHILGEPFFYFYGIDIWYVIIPSHLIISHLLVID